MDSDEEMIHHFSHEHPLFRIPFLEVAEWSEYCYGCHKFLSPGEAIYACKHKCYDSYIHQECAEMPIKIRHAAHTSHPLTQTAEYIHLAQNVDGPSILSCALCEGPKYGLLYECSEGCAMIWIHLGCAGGWDAADEAASAAETKRHPSHPRHELRLQKRRKESCSFHCNACGTIEKGNSYICSICNYWIHQTCAGLPQTKDFPLHHPNHPLSLSFYLPYEYSRYEYTCAVCDGPLGLRPWVYHCRLCRYVVHVKCATNATPTHRINIAADDGKGIIKFPINDMYEEIIKTFANKKQNIFSKIFIPSEESHDKNIKHKFHNHHHPLNFAKFGLSNSSDHDDDDDDDDDDIASSVISLTCDGCTLPIHKKCGSYMFCGECDYFLHASCFNLPQKLSSHPLHPEKGHKLTLLQKSNKLKDWSKCGACNYSTNGLFYGCTKCDFILDIKCASLPQAIKHAGHARPHHSLKLQVAGSHDPSLCGACYHYIYASKNYYRCESCRFSMCFECVFLPGSSKHRLEKHRMPLTYDASANHPSDFYCGSCERKMDPRTWMYHCPHCDESFHPRCFPATSGGYKNINFGSQQQYYVNVTTDYHQPHHPLKFQLITKKKHCDLCPRHDQYKNVYEEPGFQCAHCNFVVCINDHPNLSITPSST